MGTLARMNDVLEIRLTAPESMDEWIAAADILREYRATLTVDISFSPFEQEVADPQAAFGAPGCQLLLAWVDGALAGCGAVVDLPQAPEPNACEMRRLYVRPVFRRFGLGRALAEALMVAALERGYAMIYLDTLSDMEAARGLYVSLGFESTEPYYYNPLPGAHYYKASLDGVRSRY